MKAIFLRELLASLAYWQRKANRLVYHSLSASIQDNIAENEEFWHIIVRDSLVFFSVLFGHLLLRLQKNIAH
jgi:hypothetical protein